MADLRGWCNRQHNRFWPCHWGFESSPPSSQQCGLAPSSSGRGRRPLKAVTAVRICSGLQHRSPADPARMGRASARRERTRCASHARVKRRATRRNNERARYPPLRRCPVVPSCGITRRRARVFTCARVARDACKIVMQTSITTSMKRVESTSGYVSGRKAHELEKLIGIVHSRDARRGNA